MYGYRVASFLAQRATVTASGLRRLPACNCSGEIAGISTNDLEEVEPPWDLLRKTSVSVPRAELDPGLK